VEAGGRLLSRWLSVGLAASGMAFGISERGLWVVACRVQLTKGNWQSPQAKNGHPVPVLAL
jgi:hypothetical protein